jgi:hypothetical protein
MDASHAGLLLSRRREICSYNVKSIAPAALFRARITSQPSAVRVSRSCVIGGRWLAIRLAFPDRAGYECDP